MTIPKTRLEPAEIIRKSAARLAADEPGLDRPRERTVAARAACELAERLRPEQLAEVGDALTYALEATLSGTCSPRCCDASLVRARQIQAKAAVLRALLRAARRAPVATDAFVASLPSTLVSGLAAPGNRRLALPTVELLAACPAARHRHVDTLVGVLTAPADAHRWPVREAAVRALGRLGGGAPAEARVAIDRMRDQPPRALQRAADRAFRATHGAPDPRDVTVRLVLGFYRSYAYVGPERIRVAAAREPEGTVITSAAALRAWALAHPDAASGATYVIDTRGKLRLAPRRSEHVACAGGGRVLAAGELCVAGGAILSLTNQSTGYCPEPRCFPAVRDALAAAGIGAPARWTHAFTFRRCTCGQINLIKDADYTCGVCGRDLPEEWNFG